MYIVNNDTVINKFACFILELKEKLKFPPVVVDYYQPLESLYFEQITNLGLPIMGDGIFGQYCNRDETGDRLLRDLFSSSVNTILKESPKVNELLEKILFSKLSQEHLPTKNIVFLNVPDSVKAKLKEGFKNVVELNLNSTDNDNMGSLIKTLDDCEVVEDISEEVIKMLE